jgi:hypothetical protein
LTPSAQPSKNSVEQSDGSILLLDAEMQRVEKASLTTAQKRVAEAIVVFCGIRPQVKFTPFIVSIWCRTLGDFDMQIVHRSVLECALSQADFVGLPQVFQRCRELSRDDSVYCPSRNEKQIPKSLIHRVAENLGVDSGQKIGKHTGSNVGRKIQN